MLNKKRRSPDMSRPVRGSAKSLGKNFTKERIKERIENKLQRTAISSRPFQVLCKQKKLI